MWRSPEVIANYVKFLRQVHKGAVLILEDRAQRLVYERYLDSKNCKIDVAGDKARVRETIGLLEDRSIKGIVGVVDRDLDGLTNTIVPTENLIHGDCHDVESMLVKSRALEKVLLELGSTSKIKNLQDGAGISIREILQRAALPIGYLRWISVSSGLNLTFEGLKFSRFVDGQTLAVDNEKLVKCVKDLSQRPDLNGSDLVSAVETRISEGHDPFEVCNGHDLVEVISLGLRKAIGSQVATRVTPEAIEQELRLAYEKEDFQESDFRRRLEAWQERNGPFKVLS